MQRRLSNVIEAFDCEKNSFERLFSTNGLNLKQIVNRLFHSTPNTASIPIDLIFANLLLLSILCLVSCLTKEMTRQDGNNKAMKELHACFPLSEGSPDYMVRYHPGKSVDHIIMC